MEVNEDECTRVQKNKTSNSSLHIFSLNNCYVLHFGIVVCSVGISQSEFWHNIYGGKGIVKFTCFSFLLLDKGHERKKIYMKRQVLSQFYIYALKFICIECLTKHQKIIDNSNPRNLKICTFYTLIKEYFLSAKSCSLMYISYKGVNIVHRTVRISNKHGLFLNQEINETVRKF